MNLLLSPSTERMKTSLLLAVIACIALFGAGCNRTPDPPPFTANTDEELVLDEGDGRTDIASNGPGNASDGDPNEVVEEEDGSPFPDRVGWDDDEISPSELGARIDDAMRNLSMAWGEATTDISDKRNKKYLDGDQLKGSEDIKIQDSETFSIHYHMPKMSVRNWIVADGATRARLEDDEWSVLPAFRSSNRSPRLSESEVLSWPEEFPRRMFEHFSDNQDHWAPLLKAWEDEVAGYEVVITKKSVEQSGRRVPFFRVVATRPGELLTEIEVIIHGETYLPQTIHANVGPEESGLRMRWIARWFFSGSFSDTDFTIPSFEK